MFSFVKAKGFPRRMLSPWISMAPSLLEENDLAPGLSEPFATATAASIVR